MTTEIEGPDLGSSQENLPNRSTRMKGEVDCSK